MQYSHAVDCKDFYRKELKKSINTKSIYKYQFDVKWLTLENDSLKDDLAKTQTQLADLESKNGALNRKKDELLKENTALKDCVANQDNQLKS